MTDYGIVRSRTRQSSWQRVLDVKLTACDMAIWLGGALVVAFIAAMVGSPL